MTAEKEKPPIEDREWLKGKIEQIQDELYKVEGLSNDFVQKGNLKSMSTKQFILIVIHFIKPIVGKVAMDTSNYVDYIYELLAKLGYPFTINKSWLKTPNAPHCQNNIIALLGWLCDYSSFEETPINFLSNESMSAEFLNMFHEKCATGFQKWNNGLEDEYEGINSEIRKNYLIEKIGSDNIEDEIEKVRREYEKLNREARPVNLESDHQQLFEENQNLTHKIDSLRNQHNEKIRLREQAKSELNQKMLAQENAAKDIASMNQRISEQVLKFDQKNKLLQDLNQMKELLQVKKQTNMELNDASSDNEIHLSRLLNKKLTLVDSLNNLIHKIYNDLNSINLAENLCDGKFKPSNCEIRVNSEKDQSINDQLSHLIKLFNSLNSELSSIVDSLKSDCSKLESENNLLESEYESIATQLNGFEAKKESLKTERDNLLMESKQVPAHLEQKLRRLKKEIEETVEKTENCQKMIEVMKQENEKKKLENIQFSEKSMAKCRELLAKKQESYNQMVKYLDEAEKEMNEMEMMEEMYKK